MTVPWKAVCPLLLWLATSFQKPSVTIRLELFDHPLPSNKAVQTSEEAPLHILGLPLIVGWEGGQHRLGEGKVLWGHLASYQTSDQTHLGSSLSA